MTALAIPLNLIVSSYGFEVGFTSSSLHPTPIFLQYWRDPGPMVSCKLYHLSNLTFIQRRTQRKL